MGIVVWEIAGVEVLGRKNREMVNDRVLLDIRLLLRRLDVVEVEIAVDAVLLHPEERGRDGFAVVAHA
jgi:hypothetical protein